MVLSVEEIGGAEVLVALLHLGGERAGVETQSAGDNPIVADGAFAGKTLEAAVNGDGTPEVLDVELGG